MKLITLTRAADGSKIYVNPDYISVLCARHGKETTTVISLVGEVDSYVEVKESPDTVADLAQRGEHNDHVENPYPCKECMEQENYFYRDEHGDLVYRCYDCPLRQGDWLDN